MKGLAGLFAALIALVNEITEALKDYREVRKEKAKLDLRLIKGLNRLVDVAGPPLEIVADEMAKALSEPSSLQDLRAELQKKFKRKEKFDPSDPRSLSEEVREALNESGNAVKIAAIKRHRADTGCGLKEAMDAVTKYIEEVEAKRKNGCGHSATDHAFPFEGACTRDRGMGHEEGEEE